LCEKGYCVLDKNFLHTSVKTKYCSLGPRNETSPLHEVIPFADTTNPVDPHNSWSTSVAHT